MTAANVGQVQTYQSKSVKANTTGNGKTDEFSKVFEKSAGQKTSGGSSVENKPAAETNNAAKANAKTAEKPEQTDTKTDNAGKTKTDGQTEEIKDTMTDEELEAEAENVVIPKAQEMLDLIAQVLDVPKEDVLSAMEDLGLKLQDLLNSSNIPKLAVALTQGADETALMTDEALFTDVKNLMQQADGFAAQIGEALDMPPQEVTQLLQNVSVKEEGMQEPVQDVSMLQTEIVDTAAAAPKTQQEAPKQDSGTSHQNETLGFAQNLVEQLKAAVENTKQVQTSSYTSDAEAIMNQIQDALKLTMKTDSTEMEMQLHPASLGSVRVQVAAKEGVITASFTTQNEAVKAALESQIVTLKENMNEQGIKVEAVEVTVASHAFERNLSGDGNGEGSQEPEKKRGVRRINLTEMSGETDTLPLEDEEKLVADMMKQNGNTVDYTA